MLILHLGVINYPFLEKNTLNSKVNKLNSENRAVVNQIWIPASSKLDSITSVTDS